MTKALFIATVAADGSVTCGDKHWAAPLTRRPVRQRLAEWIWFPPGHSVRHQPKPGQRWIFLANKRGLHPLQRTGEIDIPAPELLKLLARGMESDRIRTTQAILTWCMGDSVVAATLRATIEASAAPSAPSETTVVRRIAAEVLQLPPRLAVGTALHVSPDISQLSIYAKREPAQAGRSITVHGLGKRSPWPGFPYDIIMCLSRRGNVFVGPLQAPTTDPTSSSVASTTALHPHHAGGNP